MKGYDKVAYYFKRLKTMRVEIIESEGDVWLKLFLYNNFKNIEEIGKRIKRSTCWGEVFDKEFSLDWNKKYNISIGSYREKGLNVMVSKLKEKEAFKLAEEFIKKGGIK